MNIDLNKTETAILTEAAGRDGVVIVPESMKEVTAQRLLGKLLKHELITSSQRDGVEAHLLTRAGYEALGLKAPTVARGTKQSLVLELLTREEGATIEELMAATGWLPHTTRAALSRLRSAGKALTKEGREDGKTAYRIVVEPAPAKPSRRSRRQDREAAAASL